MASLDDYCTCGDTVTSHRTYIQFYTWGIYVKRDCVGKGFDENNNPRCTCQRFVSQRTGRPEPLSWWERFLGGNGHRSR
jgi:hypothetical protein